MLNFYLEMISRLNKYEELYILIPSLAWYRLKETLSRDLKDSFQKLLKKVNTKCYLINSGVKLYWHRKRNLGISLINKIKDFEQWNNLILDPLPVLDSEILLPEVIVKFGSRIRGIVFKYGKIHKENDF